MSTLVCDPVRCFSVGRMSTSIVDEDIQFGLRRPAGDVNRSSVVRAPATRRGVLYFSTIPTNMRPSEVRNEFERFGPIFRQKFVPLRKSTSTVVDKRVRSRALGIVSNSVGLQFAEGWLEFLDEADARAAADQMNATEVFVKRRRKCAGELWTVRFLEGFHWGDLISEAESERRKERLEGYEERVKERRLNEEYRARASRDFKKRQQVTAAGDDAVAGKKRPAETKAKNVNSAKSPPTHRNLWSS